MKVLLFHTVSFVVFPWFVFTGTIVARQLQTRPLRLEWGTAQSSQTAGRTVVKVRFDSDRVNNRESKVNWELRGGGLSRVIYLAIGKKEKPEINGIRIHTEALSSSTIRVPVEYTQQTDSSALETVAIERSLESVVSNDPPVVLEGVEWFRGQRIARIRVNEYTWQSGTVVRVRELEFDVDTGSASSFGPVDSQVQEVLGDMLVNVPQEPSAPSWSDTTGQWIDYGQQYLKLAIPEDGVYRIAFADVAALFPSIGSVDPTSFRLFNRGLEIPLYVFGEPDGQFDPGDYVEFPGLMNYGLRDYKSLPSGTSEYPDYLDRYTDTSYYWLTWSGSPGKRFATNDGIQPASDTLGWYTEKVHLEQNNYVQHIGTSLLLHQDPRWLPGDLWGWVFLGGGGRFDASFQATDIAAVDSGAKIMVRFASWGAQSVTPAHRVRLRLNNSDTLAALDVQAFAHALIEADPATSFFISGTNTIRLHSIPTSSSVNQLLIDWAEASYPRNLVARDEQLLFTIPEGIAAGLKTIRVMNTGANPSIYKISPEYKRISQFDEAGAILCFSDTVSSGDRYVVYSEARIRKPVMVLKNDFANLRDPSRGADYILITHPDFFQVGAQYEAYVQAQYGVRTALVSISDIFDEFGYGYPTGESIREFLKATTQWSPPMPSYVLLAGDGTYDHKFVMNNNPATHPRNVIPPLGYPVSDPWLAVLDDMSIVPQMYIGRIPVNSNEEFTRYLQRHQSYRSAPNTDWNKRYMFFSGGDPNSAGQIAQFRSVNDGIINTMVSPPPIGALSTHFYKTTSPQSDFGPYSQDQIRSTIENGAVVINYIGHSGTQTWDNGIGNIAQLANLRDRYSLIADFGCSTAKFGESQIKAFGELFTLDPDGSAIAYVGNSALGFVSVAVSLPQKFYSQFFVDSVRQIGKAHLAAKFELMNETGGVTALNRAMMLTNTLIGDPIIQLAIPQKPNLAVNSLTIRSDPRAPTDDDQTSDLIIPFVNSGLATADSFSVTIAKTFGTGTSDTTLLRILPMFHDTLILQYPTLRLAGEHTFNIFFNADARIDEITPADNTAEYRSFVVSNAFKLLRPLPDIEMPVGEIVFLNPERNSPGEGPGVLVEIDTIPEFPSPVSMPAPLGDVTTSIDGSGLTAGRVYYWRAMLENSLRPWSSGTFNFSGDTLSRWRQSDSISWAKSELRDIRHMAGSGVSIVDRQTALRATSAGFVDGQFGSVEINGKNVLPTTFAVGHSIVVLDSTDLSMIDVRSFDTYNSASEALALKAYIDSIPGGRIVVAVVIDEGSQNLSPSIRNSIKTLGSALIDSLGNRDSWAIIGRKGAIPGTVPEEWRRSTTGRVILDTVMTRPQVSGSIEGPIIGPAAVWGTLDIQWAGPTGSSVDVSVLGNRTDGTIDTLVAHQTTTSIDLQAYSVLEYPRLKFLASLHASGSGESPVISEWSVTMTPPPELAVNFQSVSASEDTLLEGDPVILSSAIHNVGGAGADSIFVRVVAITPIGVDILQSTLIPRIGADSSVTVFSTFLTEGRTGSSTIVIEVDTAQRIQEAYKSNNFFSVPIFVARDTVGPMIDITFDGTRVFDNDYVRPEPEIRISIRDNSPLPITDPNSVVLRLNSRRILLGSEPDSLFEPLTGSEKARVTFRPTLAKGNHLISVQVLDASGNPADSMEYEVRFKVETDLRLLQVFNFPNPFSSETAFTFHLTGLRMPDEVMLRVYTTAGRMVYERRLFPGEVNIGFNRILWDGRDQNGDPVANGVYFYKVSAVQDGKRVEVVEKLARVR